jgi:lipopolysaccharide/colanic/teichoic acid biosynthesis glycosyltransferase
MRQKMLSTKSGTDSFYARIGKRILDVGLVAMGLPALILPLAFTALVIRVSSGAPVLFRQVRIGRYGRPFWIIKFRTMVRGSAAGSSVTVWGDPRLTRVGKFLRKWKLDEIPQLWNVLLGDMSLVGPRADVPGFADRLQGADRLILSVRPGITGPASLAYRNEEELLALQADPERFNSQVIFPDKVRMNKAYVEQLSIGQDLACLTQTVLQLFVSGGSFLQLPMEKPVRDGRAVLK